MSSTKHYGRLIVYSASLVVMLIVIGSILYYALYVVHVIPFSFSLSVKLLAILVLGYIVVTILGKEIGSLSIRLLGERRGSMVLWIYRFSAYIVIALVLLAAAGVSGTALLAGGTFSGLVLGLASQTVLSNIVGGMMIILARPYEVDDRITFVTWQYGLIAPSYPPKFFSQDYLMPGYSGKVQHIGLAYTVLQIDEGPTIKVPNSVMVVAAVVSHELHERIVRTKYEVPSAVDPMKLLPALEETLRNNQWIVKKESITIFVNSATLNSYVISVDAVCKGNFEEPPRSAILLDLMRKVKEMSSESLQATRDKS